MVCAAVVDYNNLNVPVGLVLYAAEASFNRPFSVIYRYNDTYQWLFHNITP